jgi:hypothetical protein
METDLMNSKRKKKIICPWCKKPINPSVGLIGSEVSLFVEMKHENDYGFSGFAYGCSKCGCLLGVQVSPLKIMEELIGKTEGIVINGLKPKANG